MSDYIDRQAALDAIQAEREYMTRRQEWLAEHILTHCGYRVIEDLPAADVEPVVRCKDCEFYTEEERWCRRLGLCGAFDADGYCSHAERSEE